MRGGENGRERDTSIREKNIDQFPLMCAPNENGISNPGVCPNLGSHKLSVYGMSLQPPELPGKGYPLPIHPSKGRQVVSISWLF